MQGFVDFADSLLAGALLVALSLAVGGVVWGLGVLGAPRRPVDPRVVRRSVGLVIAGAAGLVLLQAAELAIKAWVLAQYMGPQAFGDFTATLQFRAGVVRAVSGAALAGAALWLRRAPAVGTRWAVVATLAVGVAASGAWLVHGAGRLTLRAPLMAFTVLHQVGAAVWVGGLFQLVALWVLARRDAGVRAAWPVLVARFSRIAIAALVVLVGASAPLTWVYVGSWGGLIGTGYGSLVLTKAALLVVALALGFGNFRAARRVAAPGQGPAYTTVPHLVEVETILLVILLFTAASLSSQPPSVDTTSERATFAEVVETFRPKWPALITPSVATMHADPSDPFRVVGGERTTDAYRWSNFSHNVAGLVLLTMSLVALVGVGRRLTWARHWPVGLVGLGVFVFLRSSANDNAWPFGPDPLFIGDAEGLQHRIGALLAMAIGLVEWRARAAARPGAVAPYVFPALAAFGGILLLTHSHTAFELKPAYLVNVTHTTMGALAVLMGGARLLELRLGAPVGRMAGTASAVAMLLLALVLVFYREANLVLPPA